MDTIKPFSLELTMHGVSGAFGQPGSPTMFARFSMLHAPDSSLSGAVCSFVSKDAAGNWQEVERPVASDAALDVAAKVHALGLPARAPDVSPVGDTSLGWTNLELRVKKGGQAISFEITTQVSGFEGPDADAVRILLRTLGSLCSYEGFD